MSIILLSECGAFFFCLAITPYERSVEKNVSINCAVYL